ncbi:hypothetical protein BASA50_007743 [Batrachochytrium salamandrivorans]|uniref:Uncharacterized protein n=1 Tax=Batrachochytrium salamandrivorans TaxID=1357716 RepID=A0ABQ8F6K9_9FUNG|nr:hypothetical protein BASA60_011359 [Batrachochytrium salamandrivorans]KAH6588934.1 hypothetical protein BASA61_005775 [Batrachochytrium salamandrivorans]KAH6592905.1 hypothetical protein BASA50_007743 [Batrachochytrium salamandrivorans]KAH9247702.1 hypothetical protein BASA81_014692 [Batrachochytrium salamandrivorans]KAH9270186.1 hypothetical protein BASA83_007705 [Batrachochytrium salamandrivorans]
MKHRSSSLRVIIPVFQPLYTPPVQAVPNTLPFLSPPVSHVQQYRQYHPLRRSSCVYACPTAPHQPLRLLNKAPLSDTWQASHAAEAAHVKMYTLSSATTCVSSCRPSAASTILLEHPFSELSRNASNPTPKEGSGSRCAELIDRFLAELDITIDAHAKESMSSSVCA